MPRELFASMCLLPTLMSSWHIIVFDSPPPRLLSLASNGPAIFQLCSVATHALTFRGLRSFADLHLRVSGKLLSDYNNGLLINRPLFLAKCCSICFCFEEFLTYWFQNIWNLDPILP